VALTYPLESGCMGISWLWAIVHYVLSDSTSNDGP